MLKLLPKHKGKIRPAAIEAGFEESTASKQPGRLLKTALKKEAKQTLAMLEGNPDMSPTQLKETMAEKVGLSREQVMERVRNIATQERDLNSALKVLRPLSKELGVDLGEEENNKLTVPILNVTVKEKNPQPIPIEGSIEPE